MAIQVLHTPRELFHLVPHFNKVDLIDFVITYAEKYEHVATVETRHLDNAYRLTNTLQEPWWENNGVVKRFKEEGCRSTSIGDVLIDTDTNIQHIVSSVGFIPLVTNCLKNLTLGDII